MTRRSGVIRSLVLWAVLGWVCLASACEQYAPVASTPRPGQGTITVSLPRSTTATPSLEPTQTPTATCTATTTATSSPTVTASATPSTTPSATPSATLTATPEPTLTPTLAPTVRPTVAPSATPARVGCAGGCTEPAPGCQIKGNINSDGVKIYHVPGQRYYAQTQIDANAGERWFCAEEEAIAAGWRKSKV